MTTPDSFRREAQCCGKPMVENDNGTGVRCANKCGFWEARPPYIKVEIVNGQGIQRGHRAVLFDDTRITPKKVSPCEVEESWAINVEHLFKNPAVASALTAAKIAGKRECAEAMVKTVENYEISAIGRDKESQDLVEYVLPYLKNLHRRMVDALRAEAERPMKE